MKKIIILFLILIFLVGAAFFLLVGEKELTKTIGYSEEGRVINIFNQKGDLVFEYSIEDFKSFAKKNWHEIFETPPRFAEDIEETEVNPETFYFFDRSASVSPDNKKLAFSVHSYFAASELSFISLIDIKTKEIKLIPEKNRGVVEKILWSPSGTHLAYTLNTARAVGDYLSIDNVTEMKKEFTLSGPDLLMVLLNNQEKHQSRLFIEFMPNFREIEWLKGGQRLGFVSDLYYFEEGIAKWSIDLLGKDLRLESEIEGKLTSLFGNILINNPGMEQNTWYLSYEEAGSPGLLLKLEITQEACVFEEDFCKKLFEKDEDIKGTRVVVEGFEKEDYFQVKMIEKEL